ncbi:histidine kinase [bacterium]|nr:histidine kinase [bacterium]MCI0605171.1 histidine kinase [bacterium]
MQKLVSGLILLLLPLLPVYALDPSKHITQYVNDPWPRLPPLAGWVNTIHQTRDGYLWIGTDEGLARFDGVRFTFFNRKNTKEFEGRRNAILTLLEDSEGTLWIGTHGGMNAFHNNEVKQIPVEGVSRVLSQTIDDRGNHWIGTDRGLMKRNRNNSFEFVKGLDNTSVFSLKSQNGILWAGTLTGIYEIRGASLELLTSQNGMKIRPAWGLAPGKDGTLWIGTQDGLVSWKNGVLTPYPDPQLGKWMITSLHEDKHQNIWVGTYGGGLFRINEQGAENFTTSDGLLQDFVISISEDREGSLWIGTGGLNRLKDGPFVTFSTLEGLSGKLVTPVLQQPDGTIWIGTDKGLNRLKNGTIQTFTVSDGLPGNIVNSLWHDTKNRLWIGTLHGLAVLENNQFRSLTMKNGLVSNHVKALYEDTRGRIWIGTVSGINWYDQDTIHTFTDDRHPWRASVSCFLEDSKGQFWVGSNRGLTLLQENRTKTYTSREGLVDNMVLTILEDEKGALWIGTDQGLNRLRNGNFSSFTSKDGLFQDRIYQILRDRHNTLWMSSNYGIFSIQKDQFDKYEKKLIPLLQCTVYGPEDGMRSSEATGAFQPAGWQAADGSLWFPTIDGAVRVHPDHIAKNSVSPPTRIEEVLIDQQRVSMDSSTIRVEPGKTNYEFRYTGLSLLIPQRVRFKYKLEGVDKDWMNAGNRRSAFYTNIPPGNYVFHVLAANNDGVWSESAASLKLSVLPYFYQRTSFKAVFLGMLVAVTFLLVRVRLRSLVNQKKVLEMRVQERVSSIRQKAEETAVLEERYRIAQELHDNVAQSIAAMIVHLEHAIKLMERSTLQAVNQIRTACELGRNSLEETRRSVFALHPLLLERGDLFEALQRIVQQMSTDTSIQVRCQLMGRRRVLSKEIELTVLRVAQEAFANALKHSDAKEIYVSLTYEDQLVELKVKDDGKGFDSTDLQSYSRFGFGLSGMQQRAQKIGANLTIHSEDKHGTTIVLSVQLEPMFKDTVPVGSNL